MSFQKSIDTILSTKNVEGVLLFDLTGDIYFKQLPDYTDTEKSEKLPEHILELYNIVSYNYYHCADLVLKFEEKMLFFRRSNGKNDKDFVLAVLGSAGIDFKSLKLATNLAMRLIEIDEPETSTERKSLLDRLTSGTPEV